MAYGLTNNIEGKQYVLIFDLGGGTFDVSLLMMEKGIYHVLATSGDTHLGGADFDNRLVAFCVEEFKNRTNIDVSGKPKQIQKLKIQVEKAKKLLSSRPDVIIDLDDFCDDQDFSLRITRPKFEELCSDLFVKCLEPIAKVLADSNIGKH